MFFADRAAALAEMHRVLRPGGRLCLSVLQGIERHPFYVRLDAAIRGRLGESGVGGDLRAWRRRRRWREGSGRPGFSESRWSRRAWMRASGSGRRFSPARSRSTPPPSPRCRGSTRGSDEIVAALHGEMRGLVAVTRDGDGRCRSCADRGGATARSWQCLFHVGMSAQKPGSALHRRAAALSLLAQRAGRAARPSLRERRAVEHVAPPPRRSAARRRARRQAGRRRARSQPPRRCRPAAAAPAPRARPSAKLRDCGELQVSDRSPRPDSPASVSARAPIATASRVISAKPRVISAARAEAPRPAPSTMPQAMATTFFSAPPSSAPVRSSVR